MVKEAQKSDKYQLILEAAIKVFAAKGFYNTKISQVAKEAGVADGTIYLYFKNKQDILVQFFNFKAKEIFNNFKNSVKKETDAVNKLKCLIKKHLEEFQKDMNMAIVYRAETRQINPLLENQIKEVTKMYLNIVGEIVEQGQKEGFMRQDIYIGLIKRFILGSIEEIINVWVLSGGEYDLSSQAEPLLDLLLGGIGVNNMKNI